MLYDGASGMDPDAFLKSPDSLMYADTANFPVINNICLVDM
jgi:hypothetical protein